MATGRAGSSRPPTWLRVGCVLVSALLIAAWVVDLWVVDVLPFAGAEEGPGSVTWGLGGLVEAGDHPGLTPFTWDEFVDSAHDQLGPEAEDSGILGSGLRSRTMAGIILALLILALIWLAQGWLPLPSADPRPLSITAVALGLLILLTIAYTKFTYGGLPHDLRDLGQSAEPSIGLSGWLLFGAVLVTACMFVGAWIVGRTAPRMQESAPPAP